MNSSKLARLGRELDRLKNNPKPGIICFPKSDKDFTDLSAQIVGPKESPYDGGIFHIDIKIPDKYPLDPPHMKFITPVYHPNIDQAGRICLDLLKLPPKGGWRPTIPLEILLASLQGLLERPNPNDPLMSDIADLYIYDQETFKRNAREYTKKYAVQEIKNSNNSTEKSSTSFKHKLDVDQDDGPSSKK